MATNPAAIRLATAGKERVVADFNEIGAAGQKANERISSSTASLERLRQRVLAQIDPINRAEQEYSRNMDLVNRLLEKGRLDEKQYAQALDFHAAKLDEVRRANAANDNAVAKSRAGYQQLGYQFSDFAVQVQGGTSVFTAFAQQASQAVGAVSLLTNKTTGFIGFLGGPWGQITTVAIGILGGLAAKYLDNSDAARKAEEGMKKFQDRQADIKNYIDATTGALVEQNKTLVLGAILARQKQIADNEAAISKDRTQAFATASSASKYVEGNVLALGYPGIPNITRIADPDVQRIIQQAKGNVDALAQGLANLAKTSKDPAYAKLALDVTTQAATAIMATRENENLRLELRALNGDTTALAKNTGSLIDAQTDLATATNATERAQAKLRIVEAGRDAAVRAGGAALQKYTQDVIAAKNAVNAAEAAERGATQSRRDGSKALREQAKDIRELIQLRDQLRDQADPSGRPRRAYEERLKQLAELKAGGQMGQEEVDQQAELAFKTLVDANLANYDKAVADWKSGLSARLKAYDLPEPMMDSGQIGERAKKSVDAFIDKLPKIRDQFVDLKQKGLDFANSVLSAEAFEKWGSSGKSMIRQIRNEFINLALFNPLRNMLNGNNNLSTLGSVFGSVASLFSAGGSFAGVKSGAFGGDFTYSAPTGDFSGFSIPGNASGTERWRGGLTWLNENGRELVDLPGGSKVYTAAETRRMMSPANDRGGAPTINVFADRAVLADEVRGWVADGVQIASVNGSMGGAKLAEGKRATKTRRSLINQ